MRVVLSRRGTMDRQGDVIALARLQSFLGHYREEHLDLDKSMEAVLGLWIGYLKEIEQNFAASNYPGIEEKDSFSLPFEKDFTKIAETWEANGKANR